MYIWKVISNLSSANEDLNFPNFLTGKQKIKKVREI